MKNTNKGIKKIKDKTMQLYSVDMLPSKLVHYINALCPTSDQDYVRFLKDLAEEYMRTRGYYKRRPNVKEEFNKQIKLLVEEYWKKRKEVEYNNG